MISLWYEGQEIKSNQIVFVWTEKKVVVNNTCSTNQDVFGGVPQGSGVVPSFAYFL